MKNKFLAGILCLITICTLITTAAPNSVKGEGNALDEAQILIDEIVDYKLNQSGSSSIQEWIDEALSKTAGTSEWYVLALSQSEKYDFSSYQDALINYLADNEVYSASSRQKYALTLISTGSTDCYIAEVLENSIGQQGVMSLIYGLHLLNNGYISNSYTIEEVKQTLISMQLDDGGWAISGDTGDVDVTAMALQALAIHYNEDSSVRNAVDKALELLSLRQLDDGSYSSYGVVNAESIAQVITALSCLGIDFGENQSFIKNGNTLIDALKRYKLQDGSFSHTVGDASNEHATAQSFYSLTAYNRMMQGKGSLYLLDNRNPEELNKADIPINIEDESENLEITETDENEVIFPEDDIVEKAETHGYKLWTCLGIVVLAIIISIVLFIIKKRNKMNFIFVAVVTLLAIGFVLLTDFKSADDYYSGEDIIKENVAGTVTLTIRCDTVIGKSDSEYIPEDGIILETTEFIIDEDDTVYDILTEAAREYSIHVENTGANGMVYIAGINYLYEFDFGDLSGWMYFVNGEEASVGCDKYSLTDGDTIEWLYSCDLGNDLK